MTPQEVVYNKKPPMGLMNMDIPCGLLPNIHTEEDTNVFHRNIAQTGLAEVENQEFVVGESQPDNDYRSRTSVPSLTVRNFQLKSTNTRIKFQLLFLLGQSSLKFRIVSFGYCSTTSALSLGLRKPYFR